MRTKTNGRRSPKGTKNTEREKLVRETAVKKLLKVPEVADILGVSRVKVYELLKAGLPSVKFDGARRIHPDKLRDWIEQHSA